MTERTAMNKSVPVEPTEETIKELLDKAIGGADAEIIIAVDNWRNSIRALKGKP